MNIRQVLEAAQALGLERLDAQLLLLHALDKPPAERAWLLTHDSDILQEPAADAFAQFSLRRATGEPLAYIVGHKEFFGLVFSVDSRVLVPRPETETLVVWALEIAALPGTSASEGRILDLGTGSGAIAVALAHTLRAADVLAVDSSHGALDVARANAAGLQAKVQFLHSDWFEKVSGHFRLIASNPPYVAAADPHLAALGHEPLAALAAGTDGLDAIRNIITQAPAHLEPGGWLLLEHGYDQAAAVAALLGEQGFSNIGNRRDLAGIPRCTGGQWPG